MNIQSPIHAHRDDIARENSTTQPQQPVKSGLWKLLATAILLLVGLVAAMEIFGNRENGFVTSAVKMETIVQ